MSSSTMSKQHKSGEKRKATSGDKANWKESPKKQKLDKPAKSFKPRQAKESDDGSDEEEGGASLQPYKKTFNKSNEDHSGAQANGNGNSKEFERGTTSRESHAKQKQLAQERKAAKPLADELARTKELWSRLRRKSHVPKDERQKLVEELFEIITGRTKDFVLKHDAVRVIQTAVKYSTPQQRRQIAAELKGEFAQIAESKYAKFLIAKLLSQSDDEIRDTIIPEFYGRIRKMINHPEASWLLDDIYRGAATKKQKALILREWYGPEFVLQNSDLSGSDSEITADLATLLEKVPSKRAIIMKYLRDMINGLVQKKMTGFTMLHDAMLQFFLNAKPDSDDQKEFVEMIKGDETGDLLKNLAFSKSGARLVCLLLAHSGAKDRKTILKVYKDTYQMLCDDQFGHVVILTAYEVVDDTVLLAKTIFPEILGKNEDTGFSNIVSVANSLNARTAILYLFEGPSKALFPPSHAADLEVLKEITEIRQNTSKKDPEVRRRELIAAASPQLLAAVAAAPADLVATSFGCQLVTDVLLEAVGDKTEALSAIASTAAGNPNEEVPADAYPVPAPHVATTASGSRMLTTLVAGGRFNKAAGKVVAVEPPLNFADILYPHIKEHIAALATGPGSFVPLALLEADSFSHADEVKKTLAKKKKALEKAATEETTEQKARAEAEAEKEASKEEADKSKPVKKGKKKAAPKKERPVGNAGSRLLLEKL